MPFCINCGQKLVDGAKFCYECGTPCKSDNLESNHKINTIYDGEIHRCPYCGDVLSSFTTNCPSCGSEIRKIKTSSSLQEFAEKMEQIEQQRQITKESFFKLRKKGQAQILENSITEQKISLIRNFVIPNTKEDILEFVVLASSNINEQRYNEFSPISESQKEISDAWQAKFDQAYQKAKITFKGDNTFKKIEKIYNEKKNAQKNAKRKGRISHLILIFAPILILTLLALFVVIIGETSIDNENKRLESITEEVYTYIEQEQYALARLKAEMLVFSGPDSEAGNKAAEKWEITRQELLDIIAEAEQNNK